MTRTQTRTDLALVYDTANAGQTVLSTWMLQKIHGNVFAAIRDRPTNSVLTRTWLSLGRTRDLVFLVIEPSWASTPSVDLKAKWVKRSLWRPNSGFWCET